MTANVLAVRDPSEDILSPTAPMEARVLHAVLTRYSPPSYSQNTTRAYLSDLRIFGAWCMARRVPLFAVTQGHVEAWMREEAGSGVKPSTLRRRLSAVQAFYEEAEGQGLVERVPTRRVRRPVVEGQQRLGVDRAETRALFAAARRRDAEADPVRGPQEEPLARLLVANGLRASEAASLTASSIGREGGHPVVRFTAKGRQTRVEPMARETAVAVGRLLAHRRGQAGLDADPALFVTGSGKQATRHDVRRVSVALGRAAGLPVHWNPHEGRHTFVTLSLRAGVPLQKVQRGAGHKDPRTTLGYERALEHLDEHATHQLSDWLEEEGE